MLPILPILPIRPRMKPCTCPKCGHIFEPPKKAKPATEGPSERGLKFAEWFRSQIPASVKPNDDWQTRWAQIYDEMIRLDGRAPEQIAAVCQAAFADRFWSLQFQSPRKLRQRDAAGVMYFDKFAALAAPKKNRGQAAVAAGRHYAEPARSLPEG